MRGMKTIKVNRRATALLLISICFIFFLFVNLVWNRSSNFSNKPPTMQIISNDVNYDLRSNTNHHHHHNNNIRDNALDDNERTHQQGLVCQHPVLSMYNPDIEKFFFDVPPLECDKDGNDWVVIDKSTATITSEAKQLYGPVTCHFTELLRQDEYQTVPGNTVTVHEDEEYKFVNTDYVQVKCFGRERKEFTSYLAAPREKLDIPRQHQSIDRQHGPLNVLIWGQDSVSRKMFARKLPLSWDYIREELKPIVLKGYNIVGDGTPQALTPILTGKTELELPEARSEMGDKAQFVDVYPGIWNEYKENGYLTGFLEDQPTTGCFSHRHKGFDKTPTDFYMRTYFLAVDSFLYPLLTKVFSYMWPNYCIANTPTHKVMMNYFTNIIQSYDKIPKFLFAFRSEQSHNDVNAIQTVDLDLRDFLKNLKETSVLNSSILIVMSDHGARFQAIRESQQGKLEERLPTFFFFLPPWFSKLYPIAYNNFQQNGDRLVTPFDIHKTLQDIAKLGLSLQDEDFRVPNPITMRDMSLFREIPLSRTCADADIEPHWCACLQEETLEVNDPLVKRAAQEFVSMVNSLTQGHRSICIPLKLTLVISAVRLIPSEELLQFRHSADKDGRIPKMASSTEISNMILQLKVETSPGGGHYEVTMNFDRYKGKFLVKETDISRVNLYGQQANCVARKNELSYLRKYCYCVDQGVKKEGPEGLEEEDEDKLRKVNKLANDL